MSDQGDTFNLTGDFRGAMVNIKSTLTNVSQTVGNLPKAEQSTKDGDHAKPGAKQNG